MADLYIVRGDDDRNRKDLLLLSRAGGRCFTSVRIPQTAEGLADDVIALDYDRNGLTDFVVLNGRQRPGPCSCWPPSRHERPSLRRPGYCRHAGDRTTGPGCGEVRCGLISRVDA